MLFGKTKHTPPRNPSTSLDYSLVVPSRVYHDTTVLHRRDASNRVSGRDASFRGLATGSAVAVQSDRPHGLVTCLRDGADGRRCGILANEI